MGYSPFFRDNIALSTTGMLDLGSLRLAQSPVVRVWVTIAASGRPLEGAQVHLQVQETGRRPRLPSGPAPLIGKTDEQGRCALNSLSGAEVKLIVKAPNYAPFTGDLPKFPADANTDIHASLVQGGVVHVMALDAHGAIANGVPILHRAPDGTTATMSADAAGRATFIQLAPGSHGFRIGASRELRRRVIPDATAEASAEAGWQRVDVDSGSELMLKLSQEPQVTLVGSVRENGLALAGARVRLVQGSGQEKGGSSDVEPTRRGHDAMTRYVVTDALGRYDLMGLMVGDHFLQITHESRAMPAKVAVSLMTGANVANVDLLTAILRGVVLDPLGNPVARATVSIKGGGRGASATDSEGRYELRGVQEGSDLVVRASASGFAEAVAPPVRVDRGMTRENVNITLAAAGRIEVRTAVQGARAVMARQEGGDAKDPRSLSVSVSDGKAVLTDLLPGKWRIGLRSDRGSQLLESMLVEVVAGRTTIAEL